LTTLGTNAETSQYFLLPPAGRNTDVCTWWRDHQGSCPKLARLARRYLCIMASSAPVERVFSKSGWFVNKRRCSMTGDTVSLITFVAENQHHLSALE